MFKPALIALTSAVLLLFPIFASAQTDNAQLTGTIAYRERVALPSDAVIDVQLLDSSVADIAAQTVAEGLINAEGRQVPVPFTLTYDPAKIVPGDRYSVRATIRSGDGMLMFSSTQAYPVLTHGAPSKVSLILHTVGHGAKPGASVKKQATPAASESATSASPSSPSTTTESTPPAATGTSASSEAAPGTVTPSPSESEKPVAPAEAKPAETEGKATQPSSTPQESAAPTSPAAESTAATPSKESMPSGTAPPVEPASPVAAPGAATTTPPTPQATEQQVPPPETPATSTSVVPEAPPAQPESKPAEAPPTAEQTTPLESKAEPVTPTPEAKASASEPEAPLPEAPSASKRAELAAAPESTPEPESTSRPERPAPNKALTPLADTQWKLIQLNGQSVDITPTQKPVTLAFSPEGRRIAGSAGCNSYLGTFTDDHGRLHLSPGDMTMMACVDPAGTREKKFVAMLRSADGYKINGDILLLTSNGKTVAKFKNNQF